MLERTVELIKSIIFSIAKTVGVMSDLFQTKSNNSRGKPHMTTPQGADSDQSVSEVGVEDHKQDIGI